jgi:hypothetical protein
MLAIKATIVRFTDDDQPGWVECKFIDAKGVTHLFEEKVPVVTVENLDAHSEYPREGKIGCTLIDAGFAGNGREVITVDTELPWGIESKVGQTRFEVFRDQVLEFDHGAG